MTLYFYLYIFITLVSWGKRFPGEWMESTLLQSDHNCDGLWEFLRTLDFSPVAVEVLLSARQLSHLDK